MTIPLLLHRLVKRSRLEPLRGLGLNGLRRGKGGAVCSFGGVREGAAPEALALGSCLPASRFSVFTFLDWRRKWQPTPVFLPGESQGRGSLVGCCLWGRTESDMTEVT